MTQHSNVKELENREIDNTDGTKSGRGKCKCKWIKKWEQQKSKQEKTLEVVEREKRVWGNLNWRGVSSIGSVCFVAFEGLCLCLCCVICVTWPMRLCLYGLSLCRINEWMTMQYKDFFYISYDKNNIILKLIFKMILWGCCSKLY